MDLGPLRDLVVELNFEAHGVAATVTVPGGNPVSSSVIWVVPETDNFPPGATLTRRDVRHIAAVPRADVAAVPRGTVINAPRKAGEASVDWTVETLELSESDNHRVVVIRS